VVSSCGAGGATPAMDDEPTGEIGVESPELIVCWGACSDGSFTAGWESWSDRAGTAGGCWESDAAGTGATSAGVVAAGGAGVGPRTAGVPTLSMTVGAFANTSGAGDDPFVVPAARASEYESVTTGTRDLTLRLPTGSPVWTGAITGAA